MFNRRKICAILALLLTGSFAYAATQPTGIYVGANGSYEAYDNGTSSSVGASSSAYGYGATLGYQYAFTQNFALGAEFSYQNFGENSYTTQSLFNFASTSVKNDGFQLLLVASYLWDNGVNVFGKFGGAGISTSTNVLGVSASQTAVLPAMAIGLGYMPVQNLNVYVQYEYIMGDDWDNLTVNGQALNAPGLPMSQKVFSVGLTYTFPMK